ncbi:DUF2252 family protein [Methylocystis echinoides]|uniref:DUF2252 family protein n=1 Tax=Methylocystis echinoides TaxID=29468 RepID=UPI00343D55F8
MKEFKTPTSDAERDALLSSSKALKMATSPQRYVRGSTERFYTWLDGLKGGELPEGPPIWICGDCHLGNLGPVANAVGDVDVQIRDLDHTAVGNPAHDLVRLGLSLASAARGSNLPGVVTARMVEHMMDGYIGAFAESSNDFPTLEPPKAVKRSIRLSRASSWRLLAKKQMHNSKAGIPRGKRYWPIFDSERYEIDRLFATEEMRELVTMLRERNQRSGFKIVDAAYRVKGCSSLGKASICGATHSSRG